MARPNPRNSKYTPDRVERILAATRLGAVRSHASAYGGIDLDTLNNWERRYPEFKRSMEEAAGTGVVGWLATMEKAANDGEWRAAESKLKMRFPEDYNRNVNDTRHTGGPDGKGPIEIEHHGVSASVEALRAITEQLGLTLPDAGPLLPAPADQAADGGPGDPAP